MGLLKQIRGRRSRRRRNKSVTEAASATAAASNSFPCPLDRGDQRYECHVLHEFSPSTVDSTNSRWMDNSGTEECGAEQGDKTSLNCHSPRQEAACSGWIWMFSCFDWGSSLDHHLHYVNDKVVNVEKFADRKSVDATQASTPYDDETGESSQPSESRVDQILKVPTVLADDVSDITSVPSSDCESESDSDCASGSFSEEGETEAASSREKFGKKNMADDSAMGYLIG